MGVIDWIILLFLLTFTFFGYRKGLAGALVQFAGFILTFFLIGHYYPLIARQLMLKYGYGKNLATFLSVILIIILIIVITRFVLWALDRFISALNLSGLNRFLGAVLGFTNGLICVIIFTVILDYMPRVSAPLNDGSKHRVYVGVQQLKDDLFIKLKLKNRMRLIKMPKFLGEQKSPPQKED